MLDPLHSEVPPPRSWDQFEEFCADVFAACWSDPALVRVGRAGQSQSGVDIVGRHGAKYPVGVQCKRRSRWPIKQLTTAEITREVNEAKKFTPALVTYYIVTTAPDDEKLLEHVRKINVQNRAANLFDVVLLGWGELVRRASLYQAVVKKHFGGVSGGLAEPLLATWLTENGKLLMPSREFDVAVDEAILNLQDWPQGRVVVRQRETEALLKEVSILSSQASNLAQRKKIVELRRDLRRQLKREARAEFGIRMFLTEYEVSMPEVFPDEVSTVLRHFIEWQVHPGVRFRDPNMTDFRLIHPKLADDSLKVDVSVKAFNEILALKRGRVERYGNHATNVVLELPPLARSVYVYPMLMNHVCNLYFEERQNLDSIRESRTLAFSSWRLSGI